MRITCMMAAIVLLVAAPALAASYGDWKVETRPDKLRGDEFAASTGDPEQLVLFTCRKKTEAQRNKEQDANNDETLRDVDFVYIVPERATPQTMAYLRSAFLLMIIQIDDKKMTFPAKLAAPYGGNLAFLNESDGEILMSGPLSGAKQNFSVGIEIDSKIAYSRDFPIRGAVDAIDKTLTGCLLQEAGDNRPAVESNTAKK